MLPKESINTNQPAKPQEKQHQEFQSTVNRHYQAKANVGEGRPLLRAEKIMTSPVVSIQMDASVSSALTMLDSSEFRHIPVLSSDHQLVGMLSDRDIVRCVCGSDSGCVHCSTDKQGVLIQAIMKAPVLTASIDTDARYIARLFVEQKIGAVPIMDGQTLVGIISRSDVLRAVMHHFTLELWA